MNKQITVKLHFTDNTSEVKVFDKGSNDLRETIQWDKFRGEGEKKIFRVEYIK